MSSLNELGAPDIPTSGGSSGDAHRRLELAKWLSDWHLVTFLATCGLLSEVSNRPSFPVLSCGFFFPLSSLTFECFVQADSKVLIRVATAPNMDDPAVLDPLLKTESWQTLTTFARESARTSSCLPICASRPMCSRLLCPQHLNVPHSPRRIVRQRVMYTRTSHPNCSMMLRRLPIVKVVRLLAYACVHTARTKTRTVDTIARCADCHSRRLKRVPHKACAWICVRVS